MDMSTYDNFMMNKELQSQQSEDNLKLYAPQIQEEQARAQAVMIAETDPKKDVYELILELRGMEYVDGELKQVGEPLINNIGANRIASILRPIMINNTRFARMKDAQIIRFTMQIAHSLTEDLGFNWRDYGVRDRNACEHIVNAIAIVIYAILSRAEDQNEKNWLGRISYENVNPNNNIKKPNDGGIFSKLKL